MTSLPEQLFAARKSQYEAQFDFLRNLTAETFDSASRVIALNFNTSRASFEQSSHAVRKLFSITDPLDLLNMGSHTQEQFRTMYAYGRELFGIAVNARLNLLKQYGGAPAMPTLPAPPALAAPAPAEYKAIEAVETVVAAAQSEAGVAQPMSAPAAQLPTEQASQAAKPVATPEEAPEKTAKARKPVAAANAEPKPQPAIKAKPAAKAGGKAGTRAERKK